MACPKIERCPLYPEFKLASSLKIWQTHFCNTEAEFERCARYQIAESGRMPDPRMLPNGELLGATPKDPSAETSD